jgi:putative hemolysin
MTPRTEVNYIDLAGDPHTIRGQVVRARHALLPVVDGNPDAIIGAVATRDLLAALLSGQSLEVRAYVREVPVIPDRTDALDALEILRKAEVPLALIHDEYGHFEGIVTPADVLEAIAGVFRSDVGPAEQAAVPREDGSWLLAGWMPADEMADQLAITLPEKRDYQSVAGFVLAHLRHLPVAGERVVVSGWSFEVVDLDGRRIDKVLASRVPSSRHRT